MYTTYEEENFGWPLHPPSVTVETGKQTTPLLYKGIYASGKQQSEVTRYRDGGRKKDKVIWAFVDLLEITFSSPAEYKTAKSLLNGGFSLFKLSHKEPSIGALPIKMEEATFEFDDEAESIRCKLRSPIKDSCFIELIGS